MKWKLVLSYGDILGMFRRQQGVYDYHSRLLGLLLAGSGSLIVHGKLKTNVLSAGWTLVLRVYECAAKRIGPYP